MTDPKRPRLFLRNPESGEPWQCCGAIPAPGAPVSEWQHLSNVLGGFLTGEIGNDFGGQEGDHFTVEVKRVEMTDAEVAALPEM